VTETQLFLESRVALNFRFPRARLPLQLRSSDADVTPSLALMIAVPGLCTMFKLCLCWEEGEDGHCVLLPGPGIGNAIKLSSSCWAGREQNIPGCIQPAATWGQKAVVEDVSYFSSSPCCFCWQCPNPGSVVAANTTFFSFNVYPMFTLVPNVIGVGRGSFHNLYFSQMKSS